MSAAACPLKVYDAITLHMRVRWRLEDCACLPACMTGYLVFFQDQVARWSKTTFVIANAFSREETTKVVLHLAMDYIASCPH
jgi:hypothetical protein